MSEIDALRKRKMERMQQAAAQQQSEDQQLQQQIAQMEAAVKLRMDKEAISRYGNLKAAHKEKSVHALVILAQLLQQGKVAEITDPLFKDILQQLAAGQKDITIKRV